jgi:hypothetical protein
MIAKAVSTNHTKHQDSPTIRFEHLSDGEPVFRIRREYYKYELAELYGVPKKRFNDLYLLPISDQLNKLGYEHLTTKKLTRGMIKIVIEIHGEP